MNNAKPINFLDAEIVIDEAKIREIESRNRCDVVWLLLKNEIKKAMSDQDFVCTHSERSQGSITGSSESHS